MNLQIVQYLVQFKANVNFIPINGHHPLTILFQNINDAKF